MYVEEKLKEGTWIEYDLDEAYLDIFNNELSKKIEGKEYDRDIVDSNALKLRIDGLLSNNRSLYERVFILEFNKKRSKLPYSTAIIDTDFLRIKTADAVTNALLGDGWYTDFINEKQGKNKVKKQGKKTSKKVV